MKHNDEIIKIPELELVQMGEDGGCGRVFLGSSHLNKAAQVVWSWGDGWDHVSVSFRNRCPTWDEMCRIKDMFFYENETCVEYHPAKRDYVNIHPYCLHIWRRQDDYTPRPPMYMV